MCHFSVFEASLVSATTKRKRMLRNKDAISISFFNGRTARDSKCEGVVSTTFVTAPPQLGKRIDDSPKTLYHRRMDCCSRAGDSDRGGLGMEMPVAGLTMGMALRPRVAEGWCSLKLEG